MPDQLNDSVTSLDRANRRDRRALVVSPAIVATFIRQDFSILRASFETELFQYDGLRSLAEMQSKIAASDAVLIWFAGEHAAPAVWFARQAGVPVATIVGGYEATWIPEISYGVRPGTYHACRVRWVLRNSNHVLAVSNYSKEGIRHLADDISEKARVIYNAVDTGAFTYDDSTPRNGVLCVGNLAASTLNLKGWPLFAAAARAMPDVAFVAVGRAHDEAARRFIDDMPDNLTYMGELPREALIPQYQRAAACMQASLYEGFGVAVAEGMACGCVPVVSRAGALPEVVGDVGIYLNDRRTDTVIDAIREALGVPQERRMTIRSHIVARFGIEPRRRGLNSLIESMIGSA